MANSVAYIALLGWPLVALIFFAYMKFERAIICSVIVPFLFLPSSFGIDLPGIPPIEKNSIASISLLLLAFLFSKDGVKIIPPVNLVTFLTITLIIGDVMTVITNRDSIWLNNVDSINGMRIYDALSSVVRTMAWFLPFFVGIQYLRKEYDIVVILKSIYFFGIFYSILMLFEIRMSPQLHIWTYGFFPHDFSQQARDGGFRPVVFLYHGLWAAFCAMYFAAAAAALWRNSGGRWATAAPGELRYRALYLYTLPYLFVVLVLCKSLGSLLLGIFLLPVLLLTRPRTQVFIAAAIAAFAISYPILRGADILPMDQVLEVARSIDANRAQSLNTRIVNEDALLERANERPLFGWGGFGRNRIFDEFGNQASITDGAWVIIIGVSGWVGYISIFGLLSLPVFSIWWKMRRGSLPEVSPVVSGMCLLVSINMIELLPNSSLPPWTWLIAGALLGYSSQGAVEAEKEPERSVPTRPRTIL